MLCSQMQMYITSHSNEVNAVLVGAFLCYHQCPTCTVFYKVTFLYTVKSRSRSFTLLSH